MNVKVIRRIAEASSPGTPPEYLKTEKENGMADMKKDDIIKMNIEDLSIEGLGIGHCEGMAVFVNDTVKGD